MSAEPGIVFSCAYCNAHNRVPYARLTERAKCGACGKPVHGPGHPLNVEQTTLEEIIRHAKVPVLVDFWAPWCGPCRAMAPELETFASRNARGLLVVKLNTDDSPAAASHYGARSIPLLVLFAQGREQWRSAGLRSAARLQQDLAPFLTRAA